MRMGTTLIPLNTAVTMSFLATEVKLMYEK